MHGFSDVFFMLLSFSEEDIYVISMNLGVPSRQNCS